MACRLKTPLKKQTRSTKVYTSAAAAIHTYPRAAAAAIHTYLRAAAAAAIHVYPRAAAAMHTFPRAAAAAAAAAAAIHVYPRAVAAAVAAIAASEQQPYSQSNEEEPYYILKTNNPYTFYVPDGYVPDHFMPWVHPFTSVISGPTGSGKSVFVRRFVHHIRHMMTTIPHRILWCYGEYQTLYGTLDGVDVQNHTILQWSGNIFSV